LNRQYERSYSDSTPTVTYTYDDPQVANSKGRLTKIYSTVSETRYTEYDATGKIKSSEQRTDGEVYPSEYKYNLAGMLVEQTYPSGRVVQNAMDSNGDLAHISSRVVNGMFKNYASNFEYTASGVIKHLQIGNGLWESAELNSRDQVTELKMGTSVTDGSLMHLNYEYGEFDTNGDVDPTKNSGNIAKQTITVSGMANPFVQKYQYDTLDRITEAEEKVNGSQTWIQQFGYDRYGNRTALSETVQGQSKPISEVTLPSVDANTNRFSSGTDYEYDAVGNLIRDAHGRQFTFNGDNKQTEVKDQTDNTVGEYFYDGNGKRVKKVTASEYVIFVYDAAGKLIAELSTDPPSNPTVNYTATDPLGSPRVITNKQGEVISRRDFMPFGEEVIADSTYRTATHKYGIGDGVRQKFTGYQRDEETDLDFAEARYYYNDHGRFTAVDPLLTSGKSANPQTFNRYAYTMNRPLILTDETGLQAGQDTYKQSFNLSFSTYTYDIKETKIPIYAKAPGGVAGVPVDYTIKTEETNQRDFVPVSNEVNKIANDFALGLYVNEVNAATESDAIRNAKGATTVKGVSIGVGAQVGASATEPAVSIGPTAGVEIELNSTEDVEKNRQMNSSRLEIAARNQLSSVQTVATGSNGKPRNLTQGEIDGIIIETRKQAFAEAQKDIDESRKTKQ
jgi:RHS repeat-associated protein